MSMFINLPASEMNAIDTLDEGALMDAIDEDQNTCSSTAIRQMQLYRLGAYVQAAERRFDRALTNLRTARSAAKVTSANEDVLRAGWNLATTVRQMKDRAKQERADGERFRIDDHVREPFKFRPKMDVSVSYRWRDTNDGDWSRGQITFHHHYSPLPQSEALLDRRKRTKRQREDDEQEELRRTWCHMRDFALFGVRDFFREGGDGADIPQTFKVNVDKTGRLNNFSMDLWRNRLQ